MYISVHAFRHMHTQIHQQTNAHATMQRRNGITTCKHTQTSEHSRNKQPYNNAYVHANQQTNERIRVQTNKYAYTHTHTNTRAYTHTQKGTAHVTINKQTHKTHITKRSNEYEIKYASEQTRVHAETHACKHAHKHTRTRAHTHTHVYTHHQTCKRKHACIDKRVNAYTNTQTRKR